MVEKLTAMGISEKSAKYALKVGPRHPSERLLGVPCRSHVGGG